VSDRGGEVTSVFRGGFFSDVLGITVCEANGVDELVLGRLSRRLKSWFLGLGGREMMNV
jgi:hypothetical protein